jgi:hypothetical protein
MGGLTNLITFLVVSGTSFTVSRKKTKKLKFETYAPDMDQLRVQFGLLRKALKVTWRCIEILQKRFVRRWKRQTTTLKRRSLVTSPVIVKTEAVEDMLTSSGSGRASPTHKAVKR